MIGGLQPFQIKNTVRTFIEEKIHDGKIWLKAVFPGKDLEIRLFQSQSAKDIIILLRMNHLSKILTVSLLDIVLSKSEIHLETDLLYEETQKCEIKIKQLLWLTVENGEQFILVIIEVCRHSICRNDGSLVLKNPRLRIVNSDVRNRLLVGASIVKNRKGKSLHSVCSIESAAVSVGLLLEILAGLDIND